MTTIDQPARDTALDKIFREIDAQRARRPGGYATRCERCRFWEVQDRLKEYDDEDQEGECRRYAPRIPDYHSCEALGLIAWAVEEMANVTHNEFFDYGYGNVPTAHFNWARTAAHEWCGEFKERDKC